LGIGRGAAFLSTLAPLPSPNTLEHRYTGALVAGL
jgi:hypothetical protein